MGARRRHLAAHLVRRTDTVTTAMPSPRRVPAGTPSGGEFAAHHHHEASLAEPLGAPTPETRLRTLVETYGDRLVPGCENVSWDLPKGHVLLVERSIGGRSVRLSLHTDPAAAVRSRGSLDVSWMVDGVHDLDSGLELDEHEIRSIEAQGAMP